MSEQLLVPESTDLRIEGKSFWIRISLSAYFKWGGFWYQKFAQSGKRLSWRECPFQNLQENEASETSKNYGLSRLSFICWLKNHCMRQLVNRFRRSEMNWNCINCYNRMWAFEKHRKVTCEVHIVNHLYSSWKQFGHRGGELARGDEQTSGMHFKSLGLLFVVHLILLVYQFS